MRITVICPEPLRRGDRVAIISLSSGIMGEPYCAHEKELGIRRMHEFGLEPVFTAHSLDGAQEIWMHPENRAADLKAAFLDDSIRGIICAIGGMDTFRTFPCLMEDAEFVRAVQAHPKFFLGFSDSTCNHLMFHRLGLQTFYGQAFLPDLAELSADMLPFSKEQFASCFAPYHGRTITPSPVWYEERKDFSAAAVGTERASHPEQHGYELLQGSPQFEGELLGGCIDSIGEILLSDCAEVYADLFAQNGISDTEIFRRQGEITRKYNIFPRPEEWQGKVLFAETSEVCPKPERLRQYLDALRNAGVFANINGILIGKPMDETYYEEYKAVWRDAVQNPQLPILYNVNFGHAAPRAILPYGAKAQIDAKKQEIRLR